MSGAPTSTIKSKGQLHPRNIHQGYYDFEVLQKECPELAEHFITSPRGRTTIDFSNNHAVILLNQALLAHYYQVKFWTIPEGYLCPPIPGRVDYIHYLADLLSETNVADNGKNGSIPTGAKVHGLDIGTGANCIYPLLGTKSYGWKFTGSDAESISLASAKSIVDANKLSKRITLVAQKNKDHIFEGIIRESDYFDFTMCNPPFHSSSKEATAGSHRKWKNLNKKAREDGSVKLNFGGQSNELWCQGGEVAFIKKMINESRQYQNNVAWFTTLVSKSGNLNQIKHQLKKQNVADVKVFNMSQGVKNSRFIAWTYHNQSQLNHWAETRWQKGEKQ